MLINRDNLHNHRTVDEYNGQMKLDSDHDSRLKQGVEMFGPGYVGPTQII